MSKCFICGSEANIDSVLGTHNVHCENCFNYFVDQSVIELSSSDIDMYYKCMDLMVQKLCQIQFFNPSTPPMNPNLFIYKVTSVLDLPGQSHINTIDLSELLFSYPQTEHDLIIASLKNLYFLYPNRGEQIPRSIIYPSMMFSSSSSKFFPDATINQQLKYLEKKEYITASHTSPGGPVIFFVITPEGRDAIQSAKKITNTQGFIAIKFGNDTDEIVSSIKRGMSQAHKTGIVISDKQYNDLIVPEILFQIRSSSFVVMDNTFPNYGAYYEAGYAKGLGIPVIFTIRQDEFSKNRVHFDIQQENLIIWKDYEDLTRRLALRIISTIN